MHQVPAASSQYRPPPTLALVVPCYNEEQVLPMTAKVLGGALDDLKQRGMIADASHIYFVDDGSSDATWPVISGLSSTWTTCRGIKLSRNFGHQGAVIAGMFEVDADVVVTIDADLQDDEACIERMIEAYRAGAEVVYGVRDDRASDTAMKRWTAEAYYRVLRLLGAPVIFNHADYRLLSRRAMVLLKTYQETNLFLRGVVPLIGLRSTTVTYARRARAAGESKYPLRKMLALAWQGITSFSVMPLRAVAALGALFAIGAALVGVWALYVRLVGDGFVPGWASIVIPMYFLGGVQLFFLGVIGEYIGKIYLEVKGRPRYLIEKISWDEATTVASRNQSEKNASKI